MNYEIKVIEVNQDSAYLSNINIVSNLIDAIDIFIVNIFEYEQHLYSHRYTSNIMLQEALKIVQNQTKQSLKKFNDYLHEVYDHDGILYVKIKHSDPSCYTMIILDIKTEVKIICTY